MPADNSNSPIVEVRALTKIYRAGHGLLHRRRETVAVNAVDLNVPTGSTFALMGESGSGKSTLARCIAGLEKPTSGSVQVAGAVVLELAGDTLLQFRRRVQLIFQDSSTALNPRFTAEEVITEPLLIQGVGTAAERKHNATSLIEKVGLSRDMLRRRPSQFSGGQRQRLAIARALTLHPSLLILDEALTGLDLPVQAQVLNLLRSLRDEFALTYLFISHDLRLMADIADEIAIMQRGRIVERGATRRVLEDPQHEHTRALIAALPHAPFPPCRKTGDKAAPTGEKGGAPTFVNEVKEER
jgi:ABC-type glutathione transport system ATPase component